MTSPNTIRDPLTDHLLTPQNTALLIIDFQPVQVSSIVTVEKSLLIANVVNLVKTACARSATKQPKKGSKASRLAPARLS